MQKTLLKLNWITLTLSVFLLGVCCATANAQPPLETRGPVIEVGLTMLRQQGVSSNAKRQGNCVLFGACRRVTYSNYALNRKLIPYVRYGRRWEEHELTLSLMTFAVDVEEYGLGQPGVLERRPASIHKARLTPLTLGYRWYGGKPAGKVRYFFGIGVTYNLRTGHQPAMKFKSSSLYGDYSGTLTLVGFKIGNGQHSATVEYMVPPRVRLGYRMEL